VTLNVKLSTANMANCAITSDASQLLSRNALLPILRTLTQSCSKKTAMSGNQHAHRNVHLLLIAVTKMAFASSLNAVIAVAIIIALSTDKTIWINGMV